MIAKTRHARLKSSASASIYMNRRSVLSLAGSIAIALPTRLLAQQQKQYVIGVLVLGNPDPTEFIGVIRDELAKLGYVEGGNCRYEVRSANGDQARLKALASELVTLPVDIILTLHTPPSLAAVSVTKELPIVMTSVGDPVAMGLVASIARPGGNITGLRAFQRRSCPKQSN